MDSESNSKLTNLSTLNSDSKTSTYGCFDEDSIRLVVLGEASILSTAILRVGQRFSTSMKSSGSVPSRLASMTADYEEEDDDEETVTDPLLKSLIQLKTKLRKDKLVVTDPNYLKPFCDVIKNKDVSGPITGIALQSILKFINYGFIKTDDLAVQMIGDSVTKARFIGTDSSNDEVVLMKILNVLHELIVRRFSCLKNSAVCEIMQSCFRIAFEPRLSELLRKSSEQALIDMVQVLFQRIPEFDDEDSVFSDGYGKFTRKTKIHDRDKNRRSKKEENETFYGLASIHELLCYLTSLINPLPEAQNSESMVSVGLNLLTVAFETSVHGIGSKHCLLMTVKNELCWNIMLLLQNDRPLNSFAASLRLAFLVFTNLRMHLKYQFESLLVRLMDIITTGNAPAGFREVSLEYLVAFFRHISHLPHELFLNYDCDSCASNLLEDLLTLFSKNCFAFPTFSQTQFNSSQINSFSNMQLLSLDALLANLKSLQKAECQDGILSVYPAAVLKVENVIFVLKNNSTNTIPTLDQSTESSKSNSTNTISTLDQNAESSIKPNESLQSEDVSVASSDSNVSNQNTEQVSNEPINEIQIKEPKMENQLDQQEEVKSVQQKTVINYNYPNENQCPKSVNDILELKNRKKLLWTATEQFNLKPSKGIQFLQENNLINDDKDIVAFLRDNPRLDKNKIGEYLSNRKNSKILQSFVESFAFKDLRIDEALRVYLESFRLPGEAPLISLILEQFAHHWHESNGCPFVNEDAAFSLAYAIIMLNVDQHNTNVKRQSNPMTCEEFTANLRQVNGGKDFDPEMLKEVYFMIKTNEIIMPAEQQGVVRHRYLWKCLLRKSETESGCYWFMKDITKTVDQVISLQTSKNDLKEDHSFKVQLSTLNGSIFSILWGPTVAAMTFIFDKINPGQHSGLTRRILNNGFNSCALLCARYGHLDNLIVSLTKFIQSSSNSSDLFMSTKSQLAAQTLFSITREFSNELRESWCNIIELILYWYSAKLIDNQVEIEDFALNTKIKLKRKEKKVQNKNLNDGGSTFLSSFYSYFSGSQQQNEMNQVVNEGSNLTSNQCEIKQDVKGNNSPNQQENPYSKPLLLIIEDSKFLHIDSLLELMKAFINVYLQNEEEDDDIEVFKLEIILQIILLNRDRISVLWPHISKYLLRLFSLSSKSEYLNEHLISAIFRLAIRFVPRPDCLSEQIFLMLRHVLVTFDYNTIQRSYVAISLHSFVTHCHSYITKSEDWAVIFDMLLCVGIGYQKRIIKTTENKSIHGDSIENKLENKSRGYQSDSEVDLAKSNETSNVEINHPFTLVNNASGFTSSYKILDLQAYEKCTEILTLIIREILPNAVDKCQSSQKSSDISPVTQLAVEVLQRYVEASIKIQVGVGKTGQLRKSMSQNFPSSRKVKSKVHSPSTNKSRFSRIATAILSSSEDEDEDESSVLEKDEQTKTQPKLSSVTETCALKLLDLMQYLYLNAAFTIQNNASDYLWTVLWCPLLQGIALFCCDSRRPVRTCALTFLQRALLLHDLKVLTASQWESCFNKVLFPLLSKLLEPINMCDPIGMDETRMRTTNLLCKVFLQHLTPLLTLPTFTALWLTILDFMDKYVKAEMQTDLVKEAIPESLKNILLVMDTAGCFNNTLAAITWDRIGIFLPNLKHEIMPQQDEIISQTETILGNKEKEVNLLPSKTNYQPQCTSTNQDGQKASSTLPQPLPNSTFITIEDVPKVNFPQPFGPLPGSVMAQPVVSTSQSVYFPQPSQTYTWPSSPQPK